MSPVRRCPQCGQVLHSLPAHQEFCSRECYLASRNLETRRLGAPRKYPELHDPDWLSSKFDAGETAQSIAKRLGCSPSTVWRRAYDMEIQLPNGRSAPYKPRQPKKISVPPDLASRLGLEETA